MLVVRLGPDGFRVTWLGLGRKRLRAEREPLPGLRVASSRVAWPGLGRRRPGLGLPGFRVTPLGLGRKRLRKRQPLLGFRVTPLGLGRARPARVWPGFRVSCLALVYWNCGRGRSSLGDLTLLYIEIDRYKLGGSPALEF